MWPDRRRTRSFEIVVPDHPVAETEAHSTLGRVKGSEEIDFVVIRRPIDRAMRVVPPQPGVMLTGTGITVLIFVHRSLVVTPQAFSSCALTQTG